jgi:hypothetical protein
VLDLLQVAPTARGKPAPIIDIGTFGYLVSNIHVSWAFLLGYERAINPNLLNTMRNQLARNVFKAAIELSPSVIPAEPVLNLGQGRFVVAGRQEP